MEVVLLRDGRRTHVVIPKWNWQSNNLNWRGIAFPGALDVVNVASVMAMALAFLASVLPLEERCTNCLPLKRNRRGNPPNADESSLPVSADTEIDRPLGTQELFPPSTSDVVNAEEINRPLGTQELFPPSTSDAVNAEEKFSSSHRGFISNPALVSESTHHDHPCLMVDRPPEEQHAQEPQDTVPSTLTVQLTILRGPKARCGIEVTRGGEGEVGQCLA